MHQAESTERTEMAANEVSDRGQASARTLRRRITDPSNRMLALMISLLLLILIFPFVTRPWLTGLFLLIVILAAVAEVSDRRNVFRWAMLLGTPAFILQGLTIAGIRGLQIPGLVLTVIFFVFILVVLFQHILHSKVVEAEILYGAVSCYLLISYVWAFLYQILYALEPAAFSYGASEVLTGYDFFYYSFITMTTLGYGDITPATDYAKSLAIIEAIVGVFYTALVVARLVSLYGAESRTTS